MAVNNVRVGVAVFVWKDDKFLIGKRIGKHGKDTWSVPGGHLEFSETIEECAKREVMEESGLEIKNVRLLTITNDIFSTEKHYISIWMEADWASGEATIMEPDVWVEHKWQTFQALPSPLFEPCWQNLRIAKPELFK